MNEKVVVDASIWISRVRLQDVNHDASHRWIEQFKNVKGLLVVPSFFLIEVAGAISRLTGQPTLSRETIEDLNSNYGIRIVPLDSKLVESAIDVAADLQLRAGDATYVAVAHQLTLPLVSWDKEQLAKASTIVTTYTPENYPFEEDTEEIENNDHS